MKRLGKISLCWSESVPFMIVPEQNSNKRPGKSKDQESCYYIIELTSLSSVEDILVDSFM